MSRDRDGHQRRWKSLGYGGKTAKRTTWRYWPEKERQRWFISAPNGLAEFEQHDKTVFYGGKKIITADTQWSATWQALAYFYRDVLPTLPPPPMSAKKAA